MKITQLLDKLSGILDEDSHVQMKKYKSLKKVLKALRKEKSDLQKTLENTGDEEIRHGIEIRLKVITAQRKKGLELLKNLKKKKRG